MSMSKGRYVACVCPPGYQYFRRRGVWTRRPSGTIGYLIAIKYRCLGGSLATIKNAYKNTFEDAKLWAVARLNELVAEEQDNAGG